MDNRFNKDEARKTLQSPLIAKVLALKPPIKKSGKDTFTDEEAFAIIAAVQRGVERKEIAKSIGITTSGLYSKMGIWALNSVLMMDLKNASTKG